MDNRQLDAIQGVALGRAVREMFVARYIYLFTPFKYPLQISKSPSHEQNLRCCSPLK